MKPKNAPVTIAEIINNIQDFSYCIDKFLKYCDHLIFEMTNGSEFSDKGFRGLGYAAIMIKQLKLKEEEKITVDTLANILYQLLASNIIDDSNLWLRVNCLFSEIIQLSTSDIDYCEHRRQLDINGTELYPGKSQPLLAPPISKHVLDMRKCMLEFWSSFPNLYELLEILAHNPGDLYIGNDPDIFYPQYEALISSFYTIIEQYNKWEISQYDADNKYGVDNNTNITDHQIHEWYISLKQCRLEQAVQCFCSFLLKSGEFDLYTNRVNIKEYVLQLGRTLGGENLAEIAGYDFGKTFTDDRNPLVLDFLPQDEFLWRLRAGVAILNNYAESKSELYDYDILALIDLAVRERLIENKMGKQLSLLDDSSQIIYQIFLAVIHNNYLDRIGRDDLQVEFEKHHYALIMLFKD